MNPYLASTTVIDWQSPAVRAQAMELARGTTDVFAIAQACFTFVRDAIHHSWDHQLNPVTCTASEVLAHGTGYCYAKSHLLAALLRAHGIPAGLCYQRLTIADDRPPYCLHGLNAVMLPGLGWYRVDARGNKPGVDARFCPPVEKLAFPIATRGEADLPEVWAAPLDIVIRALRRHRSYDHLARDLPDIELLSGHGPDTRVPT